MSEIENIKAAIRLLAKCEHTDVQAQVGALLDSTESIPAPLPAPDDDASTPS